MGYENDPYRDEDGEPLMDFDDGINSDQEQDQQQHLLDDYEEDDVGWNHRERSPPTPVHDEYKSKPRKRLVKKSSASEPVADFRLRDEDEGDFGVAEEEDVADFVRDESEDGGGPSSSSGGGGGGKTKRLGKESGGGERKRKEKSREAKGAKKFKVRKAGYSGGAMSRDHEGDLEEMWETVAGNGGNSEVFV